MFKKILALMLLLSVSSISFAQGDIVQGPFKIDGYSSVYVKQEDNVNFPLALYTQQENSSKKVDSYETNGDNPNIETIFFVQLNKVKNIIALVSWHHEHRADKISGTLYQVYGYEYKNKTLTQNKKITNDPNLGGQDGEFNGEILSFKYKNAASIKAYLKNKSS